MRRDSLNSSPNTNNKHQLSSRTGRMMRISSPTSQKSYSKQLQRQYPTSTSPSGHNQDLPRNAKTTSKKPRDSNGFGKGRELRKHGRNTREPGTTKAISSRPAMPNPSRQCGKGNSGPHWTLETCKMGQE